MADAGLSVLARQRGPIPLDLAFDVGAGELVALVGPSGAGKTTTLRAIAGLYRPAESRVTCGGATWLDTARGIHVPAHGRRVGLVFQSYALFPHLTALDNVAIALDPDRAGRAARAHELLVRVGLDTLGNRRPAELSGGQQQRVALARALAREPDVLLLDEPLAAVDRRTRRRLRDELRAVRKALAIPIILVTHDLDEATDMADRLIVIERGRVLQDGPPSSVLAAPASDAVREALDIVD